MASMKKRADADAASGLSSGALVGIGIAVLVVLGLCCGCFMLTRIRRRGRRLGELAAHPHEEPAVPLGSSAPPKDDPGFGSKTNLLAMPAAPTPMMAATPMMPAAPMLAQSTGAVPPSRTPSPAYMPVPPRAPSPVTKPCVAVYDFAPQNPDELAVRAGERLTVLEEYDDGWCVARHAATGMQGFLPMTILALVPAPQSNQSSPYTTPVVAAAAPSPYMVAGYAPVHPAALQQPPAFAGNNPNRYSSLMRNSGSNAF